MVVAAVAVVGLAACGSPVGTAPGTAISTVGTSAGTVVPTTAGGVVDNDGDPNASGRVMAASTRSPSAPPPDSGSADGAAVICANETLAESMTRAVAAGSSIVLATGGFTGATALGDGEIGDGEIGVPFSEVAMTVGSTLAGPDLPPTMSAWAYGDLAADGDSATTGETSSLWARGGRMIAVVEPNNDWSCLSGPVIRVAPVIGDDVIFSWVGCWSTNDVESREFDGTVDVFDDRSRHPAQMQLFAVSLIDFQAQWHTRTFLRPPK